MIRRILKSAATTLGLGTAFAVALVLSVATAQQVTVSQALNIIIAAGKTLTISNTLTLAGTDSSTLNVGSGGTLTGAAFATYVSAGSWTPADNSGASLTFTSVSASYNRIGSMVWIGSQFSYPTTVSGASASISGLPVTVANANYAKGACSISSTASGITITLIGTINTTTAQFFNEVGLGLVTNAQLSGATVIFGCWYAAS